MSKKRNYTPEQRRQIVAAVTHLIVRINGIITEVSHAEAVLYRDDPWSTAVEAATSHLRKATNQLAIIATDVDKESCWPIQLAEAIDTEEDNDIQPTQVQAADTSNAQPAPKPTPSPAENELIRRRLLQMIERLGVMKTECDLASGEITGNALESMDQVQDGLVATIKALHRFAQAQLGKTALVEIPPLNDSLATITDRIIEEESQGADEPRAPEQSVAPAAVQSSAPKAPDRYMIGPLPPITRVALSCLNRIEEVRCEINSAIKAAGEGVVDDSDLKRVEEGFSEVAMGFFDMFRNTGLMDQTSIKQPDASTDDQKPPAA